MRKMAMLGLLGLTLTASSVPGTYHRLADSAREFRHQFQDLKAASGLGPVERVVFSFVLATRKT